MPRVTTTPSTYGSLILAFEAIDRPFSARNESGDALWSAFMYPRILLYLQRKPLVYYQPSECAHEALAS